MQATFHNSEKVGEKFSHDTLMRGQKLAWEALNAIADLAEPGMKESDLYHIGLRTLKAHGFSKFWHPLHIRFGINSTKPYMEKSEPNIILQENDIFFIDAGGIFEGHETDVGNTFVVGSNAEHHRCKMDCDNLYDSVQHLWRTDKVTGTDLYHFAIKSAKEMGWTFCTRGAQGHRVSEFPHKVHFKGAMDSLDFNPQPDRWILEIQITSPDETFGAFKEDILA